MKNRKWRVVIGAIGSVEDKKTVTLVFVGEQVLKIQKAKAGQFKKTVSAHSVPEVEFEFQVDQDDYVGAWRIKGYQNWHTFH